MEKIIATNGQVFLVDSHLFHALSQYKWNPDSHGYARRYGGWEEGKEKSPIYMHRQIMDAKQGQIVDHVNGDIFDNRLENLRFCSAAQNRVNSRKNKGITFHKKAGKWQAQIKFDRKQKYLGIFSDRDDAIMAYKNASRKYYGEFCP